MPPGPGRAGPRPPPQMAWAPGRPGPKAPRHTWGHPPAPSREGPGRDLAVSGQRQLGAAGRKWVPAGVGSGPTDRQMKTTQGPFERGRVLCSAVHRGEGHAALRSGAHRADPPAAAAGGCPTPSSLSAALSPGVATPPARLTPPLHPGACSLFHPRGPLWAKSMPDPRQSSTPTAFPVCGRPSLTLLGCLPLSCSPASS